MLRARALARQVAALLLFALAVGGARAHELRPAIAEISFPEGRYQIAIGLNLEALIAGVGPEHDQTTQSPVAVDYDRLREMPPEALSSEYFAFEAGFLKALKLEGGGGALERDTVSLLVPAVGDLDFARESILTVGGPIPEGVEEMTFGWSGAYGPIVIRTVADENGEGFSNFLIGGQLSGPIAVEGPSSQGRVARFFNSLWKWMVTGE